MVKICQLPFEPLGLSLKYMMNYNLPDSILLSLAKEALEKNCSIQHVIESRLTNTKLAPVEKSSLTKQEVNKLFTEWCEFAIANSHTLPETFSLSELVKTYKPSEYWTKFSASERKMFGINFHSFTKTFVGGACIKQAGHTKNKLALYSVCLAATVSAPDQPGN